MYKLDPAFRALIILTQTTRTKQKNYFKTPIKGKLIAAKSSEKQLDEMLDKLNGQFHLFPTDPTDVESETHA